MDIFDNGYLTEDEKNMLDMQSLIYLAAANYSGRPSSKIWPKHVYKYCLDAKGELSRLKYTTLAESLENSDILWDDFINKNNMNRYAENAVYYFSAYLDDDGIEHPIQFGKFVEEIPMEQVGIKDYSVYCDKIDPKDGVYFLSWMPDEEYKQILRSAELDITEKNEL